MRVLITTAALAMSVTAGWAQEKSAAPAVSTESSISAAKRDLEAIKAAREPLGPEKSALPQIAAPELHAPSPGVNPWPKRDRASKAQLEAEKKSKNWLLEAMEKEKRLDREDRDGGPARIETESERVLAARDELRAEGTESELATTLGLGDPERTTKDPTRRRERAPSPAANPLAGFMADWMTPQDYSLLQPGLASVGAGDAARGESGALSSLGGVPVAPGGASGDTSLSLIVEGAKSRSAPTLADENPYLQPLVPPLQSDALFAPPPPATPIGSGAPNIAPINPVPPPEPPPTRSKIPDFAKPQTDDKYFKPLKRF